VGLDTVEIVIWAEKEFDIEIPDEDAERILTVGEFVAYIHRQSALKHGILLASETAIYRKLQNLLSSHYRIPAELILPESEFVRDLGLD
jgi:hypothetical protein